MIKKLFNGVMWGFSVTLGSIVLTKGMEIMKDPVKKSRINNKLIKIKEAIKD